MMRFENLSNEDCWKLIGGRLESIMILGMSLGKALESCDLEHAREMLGRLDMVDRAVADILEDLEERGDG